MYVIAKRPPAMYNPAVTTQKFALIEHTSRDPHADIAFEEALFRVCEAENFPPVLRLWRPESYYVVLGTGQSAGEDVLLDACSCRSIPVIRRFSGGGTVVHGPGQLCWTMYLPYSASEQVEAINSSYQFVFQLVRDALQTVGIELEFHEPCDFSVNGRKVSGNAQRRGRKGILHHGTLLVDCNISMLSRYLREPARRPAWRGGRNHGEFLTTLAAEGFSGGVDRAAKALADALADKGHLGNLEQILTLTHELVAVKYSCSEWTYKK